MSNYDRLPNSNEFTDKILLKTQGTVDIDTFRKLENLMGITQNEDFTDKLEETARMESKL